MISQYDLPVEFVNNKKHLPQHTILALDAALSFNDKVSHSNRGIDRMLDTGAQALKQLREQRGTLKVSVIYC